MSRSASVLSRTAYGLETQLVRVECHLAGGLPGTTIVGLAEGAAREARDRVKSAIRNSGFSYPVSHITINLAPSHLSKSGTGFDLPIAMAILVASEQLPSARTRPNRIYWGVGVIRRTAPSAQCTGKRCILLPSRPSSLSTSGKRQ